jgi:hypothetical protein
MLRLDNIIERSSLRRRSSSEVLADTDVPLFDLVWGRSELSNGQKALLHILMKYQQLVALGKMEDSITYRRNARDLGVQVVLVKDLSAFHDVELELDMLVMPPSTHRGQRRGLIYAKLYHRRLDTYTALDLRAAIRRCYLCRSIAMETMPNETPMEFPMSSDRAMASLHVQPRRLSIEMSPVCVFSLGISRYPAAIQATSQMPSRLPPKGLGQVVKEEVPHVFRRSKA